MINQHLHILFEYGQHDLLPFSSSQIRLLRPLRHPYLKNFFKTTFGTEYFGQPVDAVVVDRLWRPRVNLSFAKSLVSDIRRSKAKFIYTLDDNFLKLNIAALDFVPSKEMSDVVKYFLESADGVIVTTNGLKDQLLEFTPHILVVPNMLDEQLFSLDIHTHVPKEKITLGYMGTNTHDSDLKMILPVIQKIMQTYPGRIQFQVLGVTTKEETVRALAALPAELLSLNASFSSYDKFVPWFQRNIRWDIGLCPLLDTPFNQCKSDIKHLDYGAAGIAGVYSRVPAYDTTIQHLETGYLAINTVESWVEGIVQLINDVDLRCRIATNAHNYVVSRRTVKASAGNLVNAVNTILGRKDGL